MCFVFFSSCLYIINSINSNVPSSHVLCFFREDFMRARQPVKWSSLGPLNMLSFSPRMYRSVKAILGYLMFLPCRNSSMQLPEQANLSLSLWLPSSFLQGLPTPTRMSMYV